jgi:N-acetyl-beta-hexosaminidase
MLSVPKARLRPLFAAIVFFSATLSHAQQNIHPALLPEPVHVSYGSGYIPLSELCLQPLHNPAAEDRFALQMLITGLGESPASCPLGHGVAIQLERTGPVAALPVHGETPGPDSREAYTIDVTKQGVVLRGHSSAAEYYAVETLLQMIKHDTQGRPRLPLAHVADWPALSYRATLVDVGSEGPMLTFAELERQIDFLAKWKDNQFFFYSEGGIEMKGYPLLNPDARFTQDQIRELVAYARQRHIDVVPAIEMYGHLHDLFHIEKYADLADFPHGGQFDATNPEVKKVLADWAGQIASLFPSPFVDVGFDETWSLQQAAAQKSDSTPVQLFIRQLNTVAKLFQERGKTVMAYADIMVKFPGIVAQLPHGIIALPWWYDAAPDPEYHRWLDPLIAEHIIV